MRRNVAMAGLFAGGVMVGVALSLAWVAAGGTVPGVTDTASPDCSDQHASDGRDQGAEVNAEPSLGGNQAPRPRPGSR
jgi:hypothetical protein